MLSNKTKGEKRKAFILLWFVLAFCYYHIRFTGGIGLDLINQLIVSDASNELIYEDESWKAFFPRKEKLTDELAILKDDTQTDLNLAMESQREGGTKENLELVTASLDEISRKLQTVQAGYTTALENVIDKSDTSTEEAQLSSRISQLAAETGIEIVETSPVTSFRQSNLYDANTNRVSSIPDGKQAVAGAPVINDEQINQLLKSDGLTCREYKLTGSPLLFYLLLKQMESLEQDVFVLDVEVAKTRPQGGEASQIEYSMLLVY